MGRCLIHESQDLTTIGNVNIIISPLETGNTLLCEYLNVLNTSIVFKETCLGYKISSERFRNVSSLVIAVNES